MSDVSRRRARRGRSHGGVGLRVVARFALADRTRVRLAIRALGLLSLEDARGGAALVGVRVLHDPVGRASLVILGEMLGDRQAFRRDEQQAVAVLPLLHLVAGADPAAELRLG